MTGGVVAVLGRAGRNFGAGMSNGLAYVFDETDTFASRVNHDLVVLAEADQQDDVLLQLLPDGRCERWVHGVSLGQWSSLRNLITLRLRFSAKYAARKLSGARCT